MRPLGVVLGAEAIERALLGRECGAGRPNRLRLKRLVHPFVRAVVLRRCWPDALMLNAEGFVAECTADNVFIVKRGEIFTPPITAGALRGITRSVVFEIAAELGIKITETDITRHDVFIDDDLGIVIGGANGGCQSECKHHRAENGVTKHEWILGMFG